MKVAIQEAYLMESPSYQITMEDGYGSDWCYLMVAKDFDGIEYTHYRTFERYQVEDANKIIASINARGIIDLEHWSEGTAWDYYKEPQTYQEEKDEAYFNGTA